MVNVAGVFDWPEVVCWLIGLPVMLGINAYFAWKAYTSAVIASKKSKKNRVRQLIDSAIFATTVCNTCCVLTVVCMYCFQQLSCTLLIRIAAVFYQTSKLIMYTVFVFRVQKVYENSTYAYNNRMLHALLGFCWVIGVVLLGVSIITPKSKGKTKASIRHCDNEFLNWHTAAVCALDVLMCASCLWMFTRPLQRIQKQHDLAKIPRSGMQRRNSMAKFLKLRRLATRYTVVTWTAVCTTAIFMLTLATLKTTFLATIDMAINSLCVGLMTNWYEQHFEKLCAVSLFIFRCCVRCDFNDSRITERMTPHLESPTSTTLKTGKNVPIIVLEKPPSVG